MADKLVLKQVIQNRSQTACPIIVKLTSEYYRELGDFSSCLELLDRISANQEGGRKTIAGMIRDHALAKDRKTFVL